MDDRHQLSPRHLIVRWVGILVIIGAAFIAFRHFRLRPPVESLREPAGEYEVEDWSRMPVAGEESRPYCSDPTVFNRATPEVTGLRADYVTDDMQRSVMIERRECRSGEHAPCFSCGESVEYRTQAIPRLREEAPMLCASAVHLLERSVDIPSDQRRSLIEEFLRTEGQHLVEVQSGQHVCIHRSVVRIEHLYP